MKDFLNIVKGDEICDFFHQDLSNIEEGEVAHFEGMLIPLGDQTMRVEWFFNGEPLKASHRVRTVYAFGMVVLEIIGTKVSTVGQDQVTTRLGGCCVLLSSGLWI